MDRLKIILEISFILACFIISNTSLASDDETYSVPKPAVSSLDESAQERQTLRQLAAALAAGGGSWSPFHRTKIGDEESKEGLDLAIPDMNCSVDEIANYVSCFGSPIASNEGAELRFKGLIDELQTVLPPERWTGAETEPRSGSIHSYSFGDPVSNAEIDIDIATQWSPDEDVSYVVTIFGWAAIAPRL